MCISFRWAVWQLHVLFTIQQHFLFPCHINTVRLWVSDSIKHLVQTNSSRQQQKIETIYFCSSLCSVCRCWFNMTHNILPAYFCLGVVVVATDFSTGFFSSRIRYMMCMFHYIVAFHSIWEKKDKRIPGRDEGGEIPLSL